MDLCFGLCLNSYCAAIFVDLFFIEFFAYHIHHSTNVCILIYLLHDDENDDE